MTDDPAAAADTYFTAWKARDFQALRAVLADSATFRGPLGAANDADACVRGLQRMAENLTDLIVLMRFVDGPDVLTWFDLYLDDLPAIPTANWSHVENGKIARIRVTFDPRPIVDQ